MPIRRAISPIAAALTAAMLLAVAVGTATAGRISISNQNIRVSWSALEFIGEGAFSVTVRCSVKLEGSLHGRTITKVPRGLIGMITRAEVRQETCVNGLIYTFNGIETYNGTRPQSLPWHLTYEGFEGTLPEIRALNLLLRGIRVGLRVEGFCLAQFGTATDNLLLRFVRNTMNGVLTGVAPVAGSNVLTVFRVDGGAICPPSGRLSGTGDPAVLNEIARLTVTLI